MTNFTNIVAKINNILNEDSNGQTSVVESKLITSEDEEIFMPDAKLKKLRVADSCVACGSCFLMTNKLKENSNGQASVVGLGLITREDEKKLLEIIKNCPVGAITIECLDLGSENKEYSIEEIINKINVLKEIVASYDEYRFNKSDYSVPEAYSSNERRYEYKSDDRAEREGLREFDRIMYSQKRPLVQKVLVEYKTRVLQKYVSYKKENGNYYYDVNDRISSVLKGIQTEINVFTNNKIKLDKDFSKFEVIPVFGIKGDKIDRELFVYQINHLEEIYIVDNIINELEPLSWFDSYVNTKDIEDHRGKDVYCYDLREVTNKFGNQILDEVAYVLNSYDGVKQLLKSPIQKFTNDVKNELDNKISILSEEIDKCLK